VEKLVEKVNAPSGWAAGQFDVEAALRRQLAIPQARDRRYASQISSRIIAKLINRITFPDRQPNVQ